MAMLNELVQQLSENHLSRGHLSSQFLQFKWHNSRACLTQLFRHIPLTSS